MTNKQKHSDIPEPEELPQERYDAPAYDLGFIRLRSAVWTARFDSPIYIGEIVLDLGL